MRRSAAKLVLATFLTAGGCPAPRGPAHQIESAPAVQTAALAVDSALRVVARAPLWPGFDPLATPVAIFDGTRTYLFRHPAPPGGYAAVGGGGDVAVRDGRDPAITANTSATLADVSTATVMLDARRGVDEMAALTVHELFHVFQRARHPSWQANEADLFTYPVEDSAALALRLEETNALAQASSATAVDAARCWARAFLDARHRRFASLGTAAAAYERGTELNEGLARYVEQRASGAPATIDAVDAPAAQVRQRAYTVGAAIARVLDQVRPDWREALERSPAKATPPLDSLLADAVGSPARPPSCAPEPGLKARWSARAGEEVRALIAERARVREEYLARPGWRLVVEVDSGPFFPKGFDPLNVSRLSPTEILHTRYLKLQGTLGTLEVLGANALTEGAPGQHPLFNGVRRVTLAGLPTAPSMHDSAGVLAVDVPGVVIRLRGARAEVIGQTVRVKGH